MLRFPPKKILVPFDLSDRSLYAWKHARNLARRFGASIEILYIAECFSTALWSWPHPRFDIRFRREILTHIRSKIGGAYPIHILEGDPVVIVLRVARTHKPDLIVMGAPSHTGFDRFRFGSVADSVVRLSPVPVMTVRNEPQPVHSVLAPINWTSCSEYSFFYAAGVAAALKARLTALYVAADPLDDSKFALSTLTRRLPLTVRKACKPQAQPDYGQPAEGILSEAGKHGLVVLGEDRKALFKDLIFKTTTEWILRHSPVPVLSVPAPHVPFNWQKWLSVVGTSPLRVEAHVQK